MKRTTNHKDTKSRPPSAEAIRFINSMDLWAISHTAKKFADSRGNTKIRFVLLNIEGPSAEVARVTVATARQLMEQRKQVLLQKMREGKLAKARERKQASRKEEAHVS
jgi:hypothetical protein